MIDVPRSPKRVRYSLLGVAALIAISGLIALHQLSDSFGPAELAVETQPASPREPHTFEAADEPFLPPMAIFRDQTPESGIQFQSRNGEESDHLTLLESLGSGVALLDFDGDGLLDIFLVGGGYFEGASGKQILGHPCRLYKNLGQWKFQDVTDRAGLGLATFYSHGCAVADYDRDGWPDLLITSYGGLTLCHNEDDGRGGRRFVDVTERARLVDHHWNTSAAWADLDGDGYSDLYVCRYVDWSWQTHRYCPGDDLSVEREICPPGLFTGTTHALFRNNGNGTFTDVSAEAGLRRGSADSGRGLGVVIVDLNDDRRPDLYAVNDTTLNFLYRNQSTAGQIQLADESLRSGASMPDHGHPDGSMGVDAADYDGSGRASLWVTTFEKERHALYHNESRDERMLFRYATAKARIAALGTGFVGFGTGFIDIFNSGWEDLIIANGHVRRKPTAAPRRQRPVLLRNEKNGQFLNCTRQGGAYFQVPRRGRGLAIGDLDNDGRPDVIITHLNESATILRNDPTGDDVPRNHWVGLELMGRDHRDIVGAKVVVEWQGQRVTRFAKGGGSYLSSGDRRILIGLGARKEVGRVTVSWPWGGEQSWDNLSADRYWRLIENEPSARKMR